MERKNGSLRPGHSPAPHLDVGLPCHVRRTPGAWLPSSGRGPRGPSAPLQLTASRWSWGAVRQVPGPSRKPRPLSSGLGCSLIPPRTVMLLLVSPVFLHAAQGGLEAGGGTVCAGVTPAPEPTASSNQAGACRPAGARDPASGSSQATCGTRGSCPRNVPCDPPGLPWMEVTAVATGFPGSSLGCLCSS